MSSNGIESAKVIQVIETKSVRGSGSTQDPYRIVTSYWCLNGKKLAEHDPHFGEIESASSNASSDSM